jgi:hypothetical protein
MLHTPKKVQFSLTEIVDLVKICLFSWFEPAQTMLGQHPGPVHVFIPPAPVLSTLCPYSVCEQFNLNNTHAYMNSAP